MISPSFQFSSVAQLCPTLCNPMNRSTPGLPVHHHLPEFTQTQVHHVPFSSCPQSLPALESFPMSQLFVDTFDKEVFWHNPVVSLWPKYWTFSFSIIPSKEHPVSWWLSWKQFSCAHNMGQEHIQLLLREIFEMFGSDDGFFLCLNHAFSWLKCPQCL